MECHLGDVYGDKPTIQMFARKFPTDDRSVVRRILSFVLLVIASLFIAVIAAVIFFVLLLVYPSRPSIGAEIQYPISVPSECVELAQRERVPLIIENRTQGVKARVKLWRLNKHDPLVKECREAVERLKAEAGK